MKAPLTTVSYNGPPLDLTRLLQVLVKNDVDFVVIGGSAAGFLGASRLTEDADCVVNRERANLDRLASALRELHARLRVARMSDEEAQALPIVVDGLMLETTGSSTWTTDAGPFDVMSDLRDVRGTTVPYHELLSRSLVVQGEGFVVHVASVDDIIAAKTFANRQKDREALPELLEIQARERSASAQGESAPRPVELPKNVDSQRSIADELNETREEREF